jgi:hypothetical protein
MSDLTDPRQPETSGTEPSRAFDVETGETTPVGPGWSGSVFDPSVVDFGHYAGRTIEQLADEDPAYLYWLARHPSGARYRAEISRVLASRREPVEY